MESKNSQDQLDPKKFKAVSLSKDVQLKEGGSIMLPNGVTIKLAGGANVKIKEGITSTNNIPQNEKNQAPPIDQESLRRVVILSENGTELREENVQEILTAIPHWMIRWGSASIGILIVLILTLSWIIPYPNTISGDATIINKFPDQEIIIDPVRQIQKILVKKGDPVSPNSALIVYQSESEPESIWAIQKAMEKTVISSKTFQFSFESLPSISLGNLQSLFTQFEKSFISYQAILSKIKVERNQTLINKRKLQESRLDLQKQVLEDYFQLKTAIEAWDKEYVIRSNIEGVIMEAPDELSSSEANQSFLIKSYHLPSFQAGIKMPGFNVGKINLNQQVQIKLTSFPSMEYGMLEGKVVAVKKTNEEEAPYVVLVDLGSTLKTSYQIEIPFDTELDGTGMIITSKKSLLSRFIPILGN